MYRHWQGVFVHFYAAFVSTSFTIAAEPNSAPARYDFVIEGGRVIDPASGLDAVRHVGIIGRSIRAVSEARLDGPARFDARGMIVAPGFIDLHSHGQTDENYRCKAMDGVTTALELEIGTLDVDDWYAQARRKVADQLRRCRRPHRCSHGA